VAAVPSIGRASLVEAPARASQAAATEGLYERHAAKILGYCLHQLGSREEAEDAVQTTFMNAFRALGRGVVPEAESAWLFKIAENVCLSRRRSSWRRGRIESPSDFDVIEEIVPGPNRQRDELIGIEDALASMPEQQRRAILLREWQGLSYREIAEELEVSQSAVETLIFRARRSLAQGLEQPELAKKPKHKSFRRALHIVDFGTLVAAAKTLLAGSAAVKATAAAVAVTAAAGTAASVKNEGHSPQPLAPASAVVEKAAPAPVASRPAVAPTPIAAVVEQAPAAPRGRPTLMTPRRKAVREQIAQAKTAKETKARRASRAPRALPVAAPPAPEQETIAPAPAVPEQPAVAAEPQPAPVEPAAKESKAKAKPADEERRGRKKEPQPRPAPEQPTPAAPAPSVSPVDSEPAPANRGQAKKRELAAAPMVEVTPVVETLPAEAPGEAIPVAEIPVLEAESTAKGERGRGRRR
jgi:RNA polymerase sigma factor (sigma-70 family)